MNLNIDPSKTDNVKISIEEGKENNFTGNSINIAPPTTNKTINISPQDKQDFGDKETTSNTLQERLETFHINQFDTIVKQNGLRGDLYKMMGGLESEDLIEQAVDEILQFIWDSCDTQYRKTELIKVLRSYTPGQADGISNLSMFMDWNLKQFLNDGAGTKSFRLENLFRNIIMYGAQTSFFSFIKPLQNILNLFHARANYEVTLSLLKVLIQGIAEGDLDGDVVSKVFGIMLTSPGWKNAVLSFNKNYSNIYNLKVISESGRVISTNL
jgi:hypothetical protein